MTASGSHGFYPSRQIWKSFRLQKFCKVACALLVTLARSFSGWQDPQAK